MFICEMFQFFNHSVLISSQVMVFGHRNCVVGCSNSGERLNKCAEQTCTVHACLNGTHTFDCEPPPSFFPFPRRKRIAKEEDDGRRILKGK